MDLMPIVEGCLAFTYNSANPVNDGKTVKVGKFLGNHPIFHGNNYWEIDQLMYGIFGSSDYAHREECLLRIDGYQPTKEEIEEFKLEEVK